MNKRHSLALVTLLVLALTPAITQAVKKSRSPQRRPLKITRPINKKVVRKKVVTKPVPTVKKKAADTTVTQSRIPAVAKEEKPHVSEFYTLGIEHGKTLLKLMLSDQQQEGYGASQMAPLMNNTELLNLYKTMGSQQPESEEYQKAFASLQEYFRGQESIFSTYKPVKETDITQERKNFGVAVQKGMVNAYLTSTNLQEAVDKINKTMAGFAEQSQRLFPPPVVKSITLTVDPEHAFYKEGYRSAQQECTFIVDQAQGKTVSQEDKAAFQKQLLTFFNTNQKDQTPQEKQISLGQYLSGMKDAYESFNIEDVLAEHNTPAETADALRTQYNNELETTLKALDIISNPAESIRKLTKEVQKSDKTEESSE